MQLRDYQAGAVYDVIKYFEDGGENAGNPIVAMPTGTGKSLVIAGLHVELLKRWPKLRILNLTHVKELIDQDHEKLIALWPTAPAGIYSAGLGQRDTMLPIIFGGVASIAKCEAILSQHWDLGFIDEAHLLSPDDDTMYREIMARIIARNPRFKVVGFTATPYRLKQGMITDDGFFTDICCNLTGVEPFNKFITDGYLAPLIPKKTDAEVDVSSIKAVGGDYAINALDEAIDAMLLPGLRETCEYGANRKSWLIFTAGVKTADRAAEILNAWGIPAAAVHSKKSKDHNNKAIKAFKAGEIRALINNNKLTTGFDHPGIDLMAVFRKTLSPGLWVQMLGRGTRPVYMPGYNLSTVEGRFEAMHASHKHNCLVLDFAANTRDLGPINDVRVPKKKGKDKGDAPIRICDACGCYNHASARFCINCGTPFLFETKILQAAGTEALIKESEAVVEYHDVSRVFYSAHSSAKGRSLKVSYACGLRTFREFVHIEYPNFAGKNARDWFRRRFISNGEQVDPPETVEQALQFVSRLKEPRRLRVRVDTQYPEILAHEF